jgi:aryl-alcohol dehydrogenase-like predicted oxidoreductase
MRIRRLGGSGFEVGAVGLGCMGMSWAYSAGERNERESLAVLARAVDLGVTLIDTADMYGPFTNEELVGRGLAGRRDAVTLATKCGNVVDPGTRRIVQDGRPEHVRAAVDGSLRRLGTDVIDLYQLHRVDRAVPLAETWGAMAELVAAGKVRAIGMSEVSVEQLGTAHAIHPVAAVQSELSLWTRDPLRNGVLAWCAAHDVGFLPYSPLGRGFLTGTLTQSAFDPDDFRSLLPRFTEEAMAANARIVASVRAVAARLGATPAQVAIAWILAQGDSVVPIPGTKKLRYLEENAAAADLDLSDADLAELDAVPDPVGTRY